MASPKIYTSEKSLKAAIKRKAMHLMNYEIIPTTKGNYYAKFFCDNLEDVTEIRLRGFDAEYYPERAA